MPEHDFGRDALEAIFGALDRLGEAARADVDSVRRDVATLLEKARNAEAAADAAALELKIIRDFYSVQMRETSEIVKFILQAKTASDSSAQTVASNPLLTFEHYEEAREYKAFSLVRADGRVWISKQQTSRPIPEPDADVDENDDWYLLA